MEVGARLGVLEGDLDGARDGRDVLGALDGARDGALDGLDDVGALDGARDGALDGLDDVGARDGAELGVLDGARDGPLVTHVPHAHSTAVLVAVLHVNVGVVANHPLTALLVPALPNTVGDVLVHPEQKLLVSLEMGVDVANPVQNLVVGVMVGMTLAMGALSAAPARAAGHICSDVVPVGPRISAVGEIVTDGDPHTVVVGTGLTSPVTNTTIQFTLHVSPAVVAALAQRLLTRARSVGDPVSVGVTPSWPFTLVMLFFDAIVVKASGVSAFAHAFAHCHDDEGEVGEA